MERYSELEIIRYDGEIKTLRIKPDHVLVHVDEDALLEFKHGIVYPKSYAMLNHEFSGRHGRVAVSRANGLEVGDYIFFSYFSALGCTRIVSGEDIYFLLPREWIYLKYGESIEMLNGYMLGESVEEEKSTLEVNSTNNDWEVRILHAGEHNGRNADIKAGEVVLYKFAMPVPLEGMNRILDREYRVVDRNHCMAIL